MNNETVSNIPNIQHKTTGFGALKFLLKKEFKQLARNPILPKMVFVFPFMVLLVFPWAANYEIKNMNLSIVDNDHSSYSQRLTEKVLSSNYFRLTNSSNSYAEALKSVEKNKADVIMEIPRGFEKSIVTNTGVKVMLSADAVNGMKGSIAMTYLSQILGDFNSNVMIENQPIPTISPVSTIDISSIFKFNKNLNYQVFMVPALMVMILTLLCGFLPAVSIVMEKEIGTMEQINVSPVPKTTFILAKLIPFWMIGFIVITIGFFVAWAAYGLIPAGHIRHIYLFVAIYIFGISGMGLVISNYAHTMQQAMFIVFFFMLLFIMLSGLYTPIDGMPEWAKWIAAFNPLKYLMEVMRSIYLKGSGITDLWKQLLALISFCVVFNGWAVLSYKKTN